MHLQIAKYYDWSRILRRVKQELGLGESKSGLLYVHVCNCQETIINVKKKGSKQSSLLKLRMGIELGMVAHAF